jgi:TldD protein
MPEQAPDATSTPPVGRVRVLLAPPAAAVLIHEAVGHPLEGGGVAPLSGAPALRTGAAITSAELSLVDDPTRIDLPGAFSADDEGLRAQRRVLLKEGVVVGVLADREAAAHLGVPAGNARRSSVHAFPRPRISNLVSEGTGWLDEPPRTEAEIEVSGVNAGSFVPRSGEIRLAVRTAWRLRGGRRVRPLAPFLLAGSVERVLGGIIMAGPSASSSEPGWCGKAGEVVPTGAVAPWLLVDGLEVR